VPAEVIGTVGGDRLVIEVAGDRGMPGCKIDVPVEALYDRWAKSLERALGDGQ
jgi:hypothetical protein